ncbi:Alpha/Beta hydrolase protein [Lobosporangium transversale]|uniref:Alpha/Beta hydrolase protein n=1 Tax=Lobosporangium transversale TaxID=64571 RepID=A0A1Y2GDF0_9FUNG|nr:Alpha/Beta hydrolase protein [Lobosporangium transversale]ORZ06762.1 Alpha/Beta hydrolase protein [Lobosporangium transversale]|eukprot:XP_021877683.1 Alpha/Beta hydrolase protein [Lobosporangium transversale]
MSVLQRRKVYALGVYIQHILQNLGTPELRNQWAIAIFGDKVQNYQLSPQEQALWAADQYWAKLGLADVRGPQGHTWKGYWIPFQDQVHHVKDSQGQDQAQKVDISKIKVGQGCDLVVVCAHGGLFCDGWPLQCLDFMKQVMKQAQEKHNLRIGFLSLDYSLSPEKPYPHALEESLAAYRSLIKEYGVDPKRVVFAGESAGGNITLALALKVRDEFKGELDLPLGIYTICPYLFISEPYIPTLFDVLTLELAEACIDSYSQSRLEVIESPYFSPLNTQTFAGLPPMLLFYGGIEILRPSMEQFVERLKEDGVAHQVMMKEGRGHAWFLIDPISTPEDRKEGIEWTSRFLAEIYVNHHGRT